MIGNDAEPWEDAMQSYVYGRKRELPAGFEEFAERGGSAVVSIDMHQGHLADSPDCPCPAPRARDIVAPIDAFHDQARALEVPIIHVRTVLRKGGVDDVNGRKAAWRLVFPLHVGPIPGADGHAIEGSRWTRFVTRVEPQDLVVETKKRLSVFYPTDLDFLLRNMGVTTVVLDGGFTDCCVLNAAFDASNLGYRVVVLRDLVRGTDAEMEEAALKMVSLHLGLVMDAADLLAEWRARGRRARAAAE
jgi:nicotinamidase-related amidase